MSLTETSSSQSLAPEQVYEIQTMAEGGQFADALIRLRKIKAQYPQTTFFVALEKQLERLLVLPRDTEPTEAQKKELLDSLPGLIQGAIQSMKSGPPVRPLPPPPAPRPAPERVDREAARSQLKEQYFQHADEYLKKGAYGSALVEIRRVKILAPDDKTALEYERTIRQLVELQQRAGIPGGPEEMPVEPAPVAVHAEKQPEVAVQAPTMEPAPVAEPPAPEKRSRRGWLFATLLTFLVVGTGLATIFASSDEETTTSRPEQQQANNIATRVPPATAEPPREVQSAATPQQGTAADESIIAKQQQEPVVDATKNVAGNALQQTMPPSASQTPAEEASVPVPAPASAPAPEPAPVVAVKTDSEPQIVELVKPVFPADVLALPSGEVVIMVQIDPEGKPVKTMVAKSTNPAFNQPIVTAVLRSTFRAGMTASVPALKWLTIPFRVN
jgi:hypothetical protein